LERKQLLPGQHSCDCGFNLLAGGSGDSRDKKFASKKLAGKLSVENVAGQLRQDACWIFMPLESFKLHPGLQRSKLDFSSGPCGTAIPSFPQNPVASPKLNI
jgi:hypothetical protein